MLEAVTIAAAPVSNVVAVALAELVATIDALPAVTVTADALIVEEAVMSA
tara:strand:- start:517 stop:666 length:150 start_codon:yes stop_codon:yes gene_type:complete